VEIDLEARVARLFARRPEAKRLLRARTFERPLH